MGVLGILKMKLSVPIGIEKGYLVKAMSRDDMVLVFNPQLESNFVTFIKHDFQNGTFIK